MTFKISKKSKWVKTDGWRGYNQPIYAVAGSSDTGGWSDSPCPSHEVKRELSELQSFLKKNNIQTSQAMGRSSNVFMMKRWIVVPKEQVAKAKELVASYLKKDTSTTFIHEAD